MPGAWHFGQQMRMSFELSTGVARIGLAGYRLSESRCGEQAEKAAFYGMSKKTPWSLWTHTQYSQRMAPHAPHLKQPSRYMLVTPARMGVVSRHSIQLMSWPYQCP